MIKFPYAKYDIGTIVFVRLGNGVAKVGHVKGARITMSSLKYTPKEMLEPQVEYLIEWTQMEPRTQRTEWFDPAFVCTDAEDALIGTLTDLQAHCPYEWTEPPKP